MSQVDASDGGAGPSYHRLIVAAVREHAAWGIANAFRESTWTGRREVVFRALDGYDRSDEAASQLLRALGKLDDPLGRSRIVDWLGTSPVWRMRAAAAEGLGGTESADEQAALLRALDDKSAHVRGAAAAGLAQAPLSEPELERLQDWVEAHPEDLHTTGAALAGEDRVVGGVDVNEVLELLVVVALGPEGERLSGACFHG